MTDRIQSLIDDISNAGFEVKFKESQIPSNFLLIVNAEKWAHKLPHLWTFRICNGKIIRVHFCTNLPDPQYRSGSYYEIMDLLPAKIQEVFVFYFDLM